MPKRPSRRCACPVALRATGLQSMPADHALTQAPCFNVAIAGIDRGPPRRIGSAPAWAPMAVGALTPNPKNQEGRCTPRQSRANPNQHERCKKSSQAQRIDADSQPSERHSQQHAEPEYPLRAEKHASGQRQRAHRKRWPEQSCASHRQTGSTIKPRREVPRANRRGRRCRHRSQPRSPASP